MYREYDNIDIIIAQRTAAKIARQTACFTAESSEEFLALSEDLKDGMFSSPWEMWEKCQSFAFIAENGERRYSISEEVFQSFAKMAIAWDTIWDYTAKHVIKGKLNKLGVELIIDRGHVNEDDIRLLWSLIRSHAFDMRNIPDEYIRDTAEEHRGDLPF